jgi:hypothetical protein
VLVFCLVIQQVAVTKDGIYLLMYTAIGAQGGAVGLGIALQAEGRGFDSHWCH